MSQEQPDGQYVPALAAGAHLTNRLALPPVIRRPVAVIALVSALLVALLGVLVAGDTAPGELDRSIESAVGGPSGRSVALMVDWLGEPLGGSLAGVVVAAGCLILGRRRLAVLAILGVGLASVSTSVLKPVVGRLIHGEFLAYPSGHTAALTALGLVLGLLLADLLGTGRLAGVLIVVGVAAVAGVVMAWSQVKLDAHYPTDTLGGFGVALAIVPLTAWLIDQAAGRLASPPRGRSVKRTGGRPV